MALYTKIHGPNMFEINKSLAHFNKIRTKSVMKNIFGHYDLNFEICKYLDKNILSHINDNNTCLL